jgi:1-acyl-sn-glycerol-3-phosphate acyltransferase
MPDLWYQSLSKLCARIYFSRVEALPSTPRLSGPTLLVALHRNGAVDGWVYKSIFPRATFLIAAQLRKNLLARFFFTGIAVVRHKDDSDRSGNTASMQLCQKLLASGGILAIFPEGTSSLGPRHLPFKSGAARIAQEAWQNNVPLTVLPLGITYDAPSTFRSQVQVVIGTPLTLAADWSLSLADLKRELASRLELVGINVDSDSHYSDIRALASFACPELPYHVALKALELSIPSAIQDAWLTLRAALAMHGLLHPEKSPFATNSPYRTLLAVVVLTPFVFGATVLNAPPLLVAYFAGRKFPDGPNVITLWRILVGAPTLFFWILSILLVTLIFKMPLLFVGYIAVSILGLLAYAPCKRLARHSVNGLRFPSTRASYLAFRSKLIPELCRRAY